MGIQCALCRSTVDDALVPGIGRRLDGWPNRDLDVGQVIAAAPDLSPFAKLLGIEEAAARAVLESRGPGPARRSRRRPGPAEPPPPGAGLRHLGDVWRAQTWHRDPGSPCGSGLGLSNGLGLGIGPPWPVLPAV